jgi:tetratricopeptide (TPR) repeat protein
VLGEGFSNVTLQLVANYVNRPALHDAIKIQLHDALQEPDKRSRVVVIHGLGGTGKTQVALNYVQEFQNDYSGTIWIDASSRLSVERVFTQIYRFLFSISAPAEKELPSIEDIALRVKNSFPRGGRKWLLVFDSADSIDDPNDPNFLDINNFIPSSPSVHVLITTRYRTAAKITPLKPVEVYEMKEGEALDLFWKSSGLIEADMPSKHRKAAKSIVKELGYLALAISLAGTYISVTDRISSNLDQYLLEYREKRQTLLDQKPNKLIDQYGESVLTTWEISFDAIKRRSPVACNLLTLLAFLNPQNLFLDVFALALSGNSGYTDEEASFYRHWENQMSPEVPLTSNAIEAAFTTLESFSLIRRRHVQCHYSMHKLVCAWGYDRLDPESRIEFGISVISFLLTVVKHCPPEPDGKTRLASHLVANFAVISRMFSGDLENVFSLFFLVALKEFELFLDDIGHWREGGSIQSFVVEQFVRILGENHPSTILAKDKLACALGQQGRLEEAESMAKDVLEISTRNLGKDDLITTLATSSLATALYQSGKFDEAESKTKEVLEKMKEVLEKMNCVTEDKDLLAIAATVNLPTILGAQGKLDEALSMQRRYLQNLRPILGENDRDTIAGMNNLARLLSQRSQQGDLEEAVEIKQEVLGKWKQILGEDHPETIVAMNNLATSLGQQGKQEEAVSMMEEALKKAKQVLGKEHPTTITAMLNIASTLGRYGQLEKAESMMKKVLRRRTRILGEENPDTIHAMSNLAKILGLLGKLQEAESLTKEVINKRARILGEEHPDTIDDMRNLAKILGLNGKPVEALSMIFGVIKERRRILGEGYPGERDDLNNFGLHFSNVIAPLMAVIWRLLTCCVFLVLGITL